MIQGQKQPQNRRLAQGVQYLVVITATYADLSTFNRKSNKIWLMKKSQNIPPLPGSAGKPTDSYDRRMSMQFANPDPAIYERRKKSSGASTQQDMDARPSMIGTTPYKTEVAAKKDSGGKDIGSSRNGKILAEKAAKQAVVQKQREASEQKRLIGMKEAILSNACTSGLQPGSSDVYKAMNQVSQINQKLGLPSSHTGSWVLPREY